MFDAFFVRHAQSVGNVGQATNDPDSIALTPAGRDQADAFAAGISIVPSVIAFSPYLRAQQTAEPILRRFSSAESSSFPIHEFTYLDPTQWRDTTIADRRLAVEKYWQRADPLWRDGHGAESFHDLLARCQATLEWLHHSKPPVLLVSHELFICAVVWRCLCSSLENAIATMAQFRRWQLETRIPNMSVIRIYCLPSGETVVPPSMQAHQDR